MTLSHHEHIIRNRSNLLEAALAYAARGWPILPMGMHFNEQGDIEKKPLLSAWQENASTDPEQIKKFILNPQCIAIGTVTGPRTGLFLVDRDIPHGPNSWAALTNHYGPPPETWEQTSGSGGDHSLFRLKKFEMKSSTKMIAPGIDIKAYNGICILAPSLHLAPGQYKVITDTDPVEAPEWLNEIALNPEKSILYTGGKNRTLQKGQCFRGVANSHYGQAALQQEAGTVAIAAVGKRNDTLNRAAFALGQLVAGGELDQSDVESALAAAAIRAGLGEREALGTIASGTQAGMNEPRKAPQPATHATLTKNKCRTQEPSNHMVCDTFDSCDGSSEEKKCTTLPRAPMHCFHPMVKSALEEIACAKSAPIESAIAAYLAMTGAIIGRALCIRIKPGWDENANLYIALVAKSGTGKSPVTNLLFKNIHDLEKQFQARYDLEYEIYQMKIQDWKQKKKNERGQMPEEPKREDILVDDWTSESLTDALDANPKGILCFRDELAGLMLDLDKYCGQVGATKNRLMSSYDSGPWKTSRVNKSRASYIPNACVSIYGTIQPAQAMGIFTGADKASGFLSRFILVNAIQKKPSLFSENSESQETITTLDKIVSGLYPLQPVNKCSKFIECTLDAKQFYIEWHNSLAMEAWLGAEDDEDSMLTKLRGQCLRIALQLHCVDGILNNKELEKHVSLDIMQRACNLTDWLKAHARAVWRIVKGSPTPCGQDVMVAEAIIALENEILAGKLQTARIAEIANTGIDKRFHLNP